MDFATITSWAQGIAGLDPTLQGRLIRTVALIAVIWILWWVAVRFGVSQIQESAVRYRTRRAIGYLTFLVAFILIGRVWFRGVAPLTTYLGLLSAGLAVALQAPIVSFAAWLFILWRRPFQVGDRIQIGDHAGDVIDQRIFQFTLLEIGNWVDADQATGRIIQIPNSVVFSQPQANYSQRAQFIWNEIRVPVTFESDWELAKRLLEEIIRSRSEHISDEARRELQRTSGRFLLIKLDVDPQVYTSVEDSGIVLTIRYVVDPRRRRASTQAIWEDILRAFAAHPTIAWAYPTERNVATGATFQNRRSAHEA